MWLWRRRSRRRRGRRGVGCWRLWKWSAGRLRKLHLGELTPGLVEVEGRRTLGFGVEPLHALLPFARHPIHLSRLPHIQRTRRHGLIAPLLLAHIEDRHEQVPPITLHRHRVPVQRQIPDLQMTHDKRVGIVIRMNHNLQQRFFLEVVQLTLVLGLRLEDGKCAVFLEK